MRAAWWWIDRWRKSTAYTDMTLSEQGAYRNLLDELWLRDGLLPADERILAKISGGPFEWGEVREAVLAHFVRVDDGYRNETHDQVMADSQYRAEKQKRYRDKRKNVTGNVTQSPSPSPSPSKDKDQTPTENDNDPVRSRPAKRTRKRISYPPDFERFWNAYTPRKRVGKGIAFDEWTIDRKGLGAPSEFVDAVVEGAKRHAAEVERTCPETDKILHPCRFLKYRRWEDEPAPAGGNGKAEPREDREAEYPGIHDGEDVMDYHRRIRRERMESR